MSKYDQWLESPYQDQYRADEAFDELVDQLLSDQYNIEDFDNFMEAINDECLYKKRAEIEDALRQRDTHHLGRIIYNQVIDWLEHMAVEEAKSQL